jgi:hypothetical protein
MDLDEMRTAALASKAAERRSMNKEFEAKCERDLEYLEEMRQHLRPAKPHEYASWLQGYIAEGGQPTHFYDRPTPLSDWYVALRDFEMYPLHGALSINVIVPVGVTVTGSTGHNDLYLMDGFTSRGFHDQPSTVLVYTDTHLPTA